MDLDLRKLRYFVAAAEHLHFGRAAQELHIAQPVLSRQVRELERELHAQLFARDRRGTELTAAGRQLLADARPLLASADAARRRVGRVARGWDSFVVGFAPGLIVTSAVQEFRRRHLELAVDVVRTSWDDQADLIRDGRVDVGYLRLPVDERGLRLRPLFSEPRVAVLAADHRLATKESVDIADLADEQLLQNPDAVPEWRGTTPRSDSSARRVPLFRSVEEKLEHVAAGRGVVVLPRSTASFYTRPDVCWVPIRDIGPNHVCLGWASGRRNPLLREFAEVAAEHQGSVAG